VPCLSHNVSSIYDVTTEGSNVSKGKAKPGTNMLCYVQCEYIHHHDISSGFKEESLKNGISSLLGIPLSLPKYCCPSRVFCLAKTVLKTFHLKNSITFLSNDFLSYIGVTFSASLYVITDFILGSGILFCSNFDKTFGTSTNREILLN